MENGDVADEEGNEWQVIHPCTLIAHKELWFCFFSLGYLNNKSFHFVCIFKLIGTRNKGTVTRSADFGRTPVSDIFRGELRSRLQREGDHSTDVMQPFFTLQLNIEVGDFFSLCLNMFDLKIIILVFLTFVFAYVILQKANSVKEALENFVNKDQLEGVTCTKTNQEVNAWQQMTLEKLPIVLILHLKWFDYKGDVCTKILKTVDFPIELKLDASKFFICLYLNIR